ncbi:MAG: hypothetical protein RQ826_07045 [Xanthomonadales bacterium]|nr:hypothetical protein [Xanthomonadales bacterium]
MNTQIEKEYCNRTLAVAAAVLALVVGGNLQAAPVSQAKCETAMDFTFDPGTTVADGTVVTLTQEVTVSAIGSGSQNCGLAVDDYVNDGNAKIQAVVLGDEPRPCADEGESFCTVGLPTTESCQLDSDCDTGLDLGDGICTEVGTSSLVSGNPFDGYQEFDVDTTDLGGSVLGFVAQYAGGGNFNSSPKICTDLTVEEVAEADCEGATISIERATGPGEPTAPGGPYDWTFRVTVHACDALYGVSAQGGTNGWAQLLNRDVNSLAPSTGTAEIRKANKKTDVILWSIGDMEAGDTESLDVSLRGSLKGAPDCDERFLSGAWSALFSLDGLTTEKTDYTGRVSVLTNSNGIEGDCGE